MDTPHKFNRVEVSEEGFRGGGRQFVTEVAVTGPAKTAYWMWQCGVEMLCIEEVIVVDGIIPLPRSWL